MTHALAGLTRVLTVESLQRLKMEALIPAPSECEVRSMIKFLNAQSPSKVIVSCASCHLPLLVAQNCHGAPVVQKIVSQMDTKEHGVSIGNCGSSSIIPQEITVD